jgi:hypothetical protein
MVHCTVRSMYCHLKSDHTAIPHSAKTMKRNILISNQAENKKHVHNFRIKTSWKVLNLSDRLSAYRFCWTSPLSMLCWLCHVVAVCKAEEGNDAHIFIASASQWN